MDNILKILSSLIFYSNVHENASYDNFMFQLSEKYSEIYTSKPLSMIRGLASSESAGINLLKHPAGMWCLTAAVVIRRRVRSPVAQETGGGAEIFWFIVI